MGGCISKSKHKRASEINNRLQHITKLSSYEAACETDASVQTFDTTLHEQRNVVIRPLAGGVEVRSPSFDSLKEVAECFVDMDEEVAKPILDCKDGIWKTFIEYCDDSLQTLYLWDALEKCLKRVKGDQFSLMLALSQFDDKEGEFFQIFQYVYKQQALLYEKLERKENKLAKKLKRIHAWRKASRIIFIGTVGAVLICSVVAAAIAAPPVAAAMAGATALPLGSVGKWVDSLWKKIENKLTGQKNLINDMHAATYVTIEDLNGIKALIDTLKKDLDALLKTSDFAISEKAFKVRIRKSRKKISAFTKNVADLGAQANSKVKKNRSVVFQRMFKHPNN